MTRHLRIALAFAFVLLVPGAALRAEEPDTLLADESALKEVGLPTDGPGLIEFFRMRGQTEVPLKAIIGLVNKFDSPSLSDQEKACAELIAIGPPALPHLRRAALDTDATDKSALARRCLEALEHSANLTGAAARVLAARRPTGAAEPLITFLPFAENDNVLEEVKAALRTVAYRDNQPDPALVKALADESPLRRATAIEVLCAGGIAEPRTALRKLLHDPVAIVRLQAGLALSQANDAEAVSTMIGVLADLPLPMAQQVEDYLTTLSGEKGPKPSHATDTAAKTKQRDEWKKWWEANDGTGALAEFRRRTLTDVDRIQGLKLIELLGNDDFQTREKASAQLLKQGPNVLPLLRARLKDPDLEIRRRVRDCLETFQEDKDTPLPLTAPRLLAVRKPAGAVEAMLTLLPAVEEETIVEEIQTALNSLAYVDGTPAPALVKALVDPSPARRAAAAVALSMAPTADILVDLRKLLKDPEPLVRMRAAIGLAEAKERDAIPVLIAVLSDLPEEKAQPAEEYLQRLAGDRPPEMPTGEGDLRPKRSEAWITWWTAHSEKLELVARLRNPAAHFHNYTLLIQPNNGMVSELGADGKTRWQITGLSNPWDASVLPCDRVLIAEYGLRQVTERNFKGEILWKKQLNTWPISAQRLPNGNTFIVARNMLLEVDRSGKEVFNHPRQFNDIMSAHKQRDGQIVAVSSQGTCFRLGADGKEIKSFQVQQVATYGNEVLPNGNVIVPVTWQNKVQEYDPEGKVVWEASVMMPSSVSRMPNGHTLVATQQNPWKLLELDRQGKQVGEITPPNYVHMVHKR